MSFTPRKPIQFVQFKDLSKEESMKTVTYTIPNINCGHCVHTIKTELGELAGITSVDANPQTKQATITFGDPATEAEIVSLLKEINYGPEEK